MIVGPINGIHSIMVALKFFKVTALPFIGDAEPNAVYLLQHPTASTATIHLTDNAATEYFPVFTPTPPGPYADDTAAAGASPVVPIGGLYHTALGEVRVRVV